MAYLVRARGESLASCSRVCRLCFLSGLVRCCRLVWIFPIGVSQSLTYIPAGVRGGLEASKSWAVIGEVMIGPARGVVAMQARRAA